MNLDELIQSIGRVSGEKALKELARQIEAWKKDDRDVTELETTVERFFGDIWLFVEEDHSKAHEFWAAFRDDAIRRIGGMTMNERLYLFGLSERFYGSKSDEEQQIVYSKLLAKP
jgi:hypothetical protein